MSEVWHTGMLSVQSEAMPDQKHIWQLSGLLVRGKDNITNSWRKRMSASLRQLIEEIPARFIAPRWSVQAGIVSLIYGPRDLLAKLIGLIEREPKYSKYEIDNMLHLEQKRFFIEGGHPQIVTHGMSQIVREHEKRQPAFLQLPANAALENLDLRLCTEQFSSAIGSALSEIFADVSSVWVHQKHEWERIAREDLQRTGVTDEAQIDQTVANLACEERISRLYTAILSSAQLERQMTGVGIAIVGYLKALRIVRNCEMEQTRLEEKKRAEAIADITKRHPIRSRLTSWLHSRVEAILTPWLDETRPKVDQDIMNLLRRDGLVQEAYLFDRALRFNRETRPQREKELGALKRPSREWRFARPIWLPKNWIITKHDDRKHGGSVWYSAERQTTHVTRSDVPFYRFWNMYQWTISAWSWGFIGLTWNLIKGPLSLKALFSPRAYYSRPTLDTETGKVIDDRNSLTQTLPSRLSAIWGHIKQSRAKFEAEPDTGFIGKTISRVFNLFFNYVVKGLAGTVAVAVGQPVLTALNLVLTLLLMVTSFAWAPASALLRWIICFFFFDFDHAKYGSVRSPFFTTVVYRILIRGLLNVTSSLVGAVVIHPILAAIIALTGSATAAVRLIYDSIIFGLVIWPRARIPANDGFLAKRVSGPGMASTIFVQIEPSDALVALRGTLERAELEIWRSRMASAISKPTTRLSNHPLGGAFSPVGLDFQAGSQRFDSIRKNVSRLMKELESKVNQRYKAIPDIPNGHMVRLTKSALDSLLQHAETMVKDFISSRVLPLHTHDEVLSLWASTWGLERNDFAGLTRQLLSRAFSSEILRPLEDSERTVRLKVHKFKFRSMVIDADVADPLEKTTVEVTPEQRRRASPTVSSIDRSDVSHCGTLEDRAGQLAPLSRSTPYFTLIKKEGEKDGDDTN